MESTTLYRKYRPKNFDEILGQKEIIEILQKSINNQSIAHAYLFSGDRGTGKTSTARIFANSIGANQEDVYEMDAASNRGINEIREIRDSVDILPISSPYKVYIIDEVHMLTKDAFNALLKTLEEPPRHVVFILATTEKEKILPTIISRCQVYDFKNPNTDILIQLITDTVKKEGIEIDFESSRLIAKKGKGSYRDTLSVLQKIISSGEKKISIENVKTIFGEDSEEFENLFLEKWIEGEKESMLNLYLKLKKDNFNIDNFINNLIEKIRLSLLLKNSKEFQEKDILNKKFLLELKTNSGHLLKLLRLEEQIQNSTRKDMAFEIFIIDL